MIAKMATTALGWAGKAGIGGISQAAMERAVKGAMIGMGTAASVQIMSNMATGREVSAGLGRSMLMGGLGGGAIGGYLPRIRGMMGARSAASNAQVMGQYNAMFGGLSPRTLMGSTTSRRVWRKGVGEIMPRRVNTRVINGIAQRASAGTIAMPARSGAPVIRGGNPYAGLSGRERFQMGGIRAWWAGLQIG